MNKAIFLDRDGTINVDKGYIYQKKDFEFLPGAVEALKNFKQAGFVLIIITNQSGIARGYYTEEDFQTLNLWMNTVLKNAGAEVDGVYFCPHLPDAKISKYRMKCNCRKPKTGLFYQAVKDFDIDLSHSCAIGDRLRDCSICEESDCRGFIVGSTENYEVIKQIESGIFRNVKYKKNLLECSTEIVHGDRFSKY